MDTAAAHFFRANQSRLTQPRPAGGSAAGFGVATADVIYHLYNKGGPTGLMRRPDAGTIIAMKIFIKLKQVLPEGVLLKKVLTAEKWPPAIFGGSENADHAARHFLR